jgi:hypothetical protein
MLPTEKPSIGLNGVIHSATFIGAHLQTDATLLSQNSLTDDRFESGIYRPRSPSVGSSISSLPVPNFLMIVDLKGFLTRQNLPSHSKSSTQPF